MVNFSTDEIAVLNYIQGEIPFFERPYAKIGSDLKIQETDVLNIISRLKYRNVIHDIGAIFNGSSLGYCRYLVAMEVPESCMNNAVCLINSHPGVDYSNLCDHKYNIWFSLSEESGMLFDHSIEILTKKSGALDFLVFKKEKLLKISAMLPLGEDWLYSENLISKNRSCSEAEKQFSENEKETVRIFQNDLPVVERPFRTLVEQKDSSISEERMLEIGEFLTNENIMRRYSAALSQMNAAYTCNAMIAWRITCEDDLEEKILPFMYESSVSSLYLRNIFPGRWEYPLFAMVHANSQSGLKCIISILAERSGIKDYYVIKTVCELKKNRVCYFSPKFSEWKNMHYND